MKTRINGWTMAFESSGQGIPLLLIHGFPLNRKLWAPQLSALSIGAHLVAPDLRGHGESDPLPGPYSVDLLADDCITLLDHLQLDEPVVVCGLSMGGYIAFSIYRKYPERVSGLILSATRALDDTPEGKSNRMKAMASAQTAGVAAVADSMLPKMFAPSTALNKPDLVQYVRNMMLDTSIEGTIGALHAMKDRPNSYPILPGISKPVLVIHGRQDQLVPIKEAIDMQQAMPNAEIAILDDAGHLLNLEQPEAYNLAVRKFLDRFRPVHSDTADI